MGKGKTQKKKKEEDQVISKESKKQENNWWLQGNIQPYMQPSLPPINSFSMHITTWNIRGCNSALKKHILKRRIDRNNLGIIFLQETKCSGEELAKTTQKVQKGCESIAIDAKGAARGMGILQNPRMVTLSRFLTTTYSISAEFHILGTRTRGFSPPPITQLQAECFNTTIFGLATWQS